MQEIERREKTGATQTHNACVLVACRKRERETEGGSVAERLSNGGKSGIFVQEKRAGN